MDEMHEYLAVELFGWDYGLMVYDTWGKLDGHAHEAWLAPDGTIYSSYPLDRELPLDKWEGAGMVIEKMAEQRFSVRRLFSIALDEIVQASVGYPKAQINLAWPSALIFMKPKHVARAACKALGMEDEDA